MQVSIEVAEIKYPKEDGWRHVWVFDHSSCHAAMALDVNKMNVKPAGKQRIMRDTTWNGKVWKLYSTDRDGKKVAKGMKMVLEERGISTVGKSADWMRQTLGEHSDFKGEKSMIERMLIQKAHIPCFLPKFHPELNPIERVWAQLKRYTKAHCKYSLPSLRKNIPLAYDSVTLENIKNHFRKVRHYMFGYLEGLAPERTSIKPF
jgi:transposase